MKNVLSLAEAKEMLRMFQRPKFTNVHNYITVIRTDMDWVKEVLPPPLVPDEPIVTVVLSGSDQFWGLVCGLQCRYEGIVGSFGLGYVMDTDLGVIYGREGLAEPKKQGITTIKAEDGKFVGTVSRFGQELVRVEATVIGPGDTSMVGNLDNFHFKYSIKADGSGLEDVNLICSHFDNSVTKLELLKPEKVVLNESVHDIYGNIPIKEVVACLHAELNMVGSAKYLAKVDPEAFLPYAFFKFDDYRTTMDVD